MPTTVVMAGLVPAIHVLGRRERKRAWMPGTSPGMTKGRGAALAILLQPPLAEDVDGALLDIELGGAGRRFQAKRHHQGPAGPAMGDRDGVGAELVVPGADADLHIGVGLPACRAYRPFVGETPGVNLGIGGLALGQRQSLRGAVTDLT